MNILRWALVSGAFALLVGGYVASQLAYFQGQAAQYARSIDQPPIAMLSAVILIGSVVTYFLKDDETT